MPRATVQVWSGVETKALRTALRLTVDGFAAKLGVSSRVVFKWEKGKSAARPGPSNQEALDTLLLFADDQVHERFAGEVGLTMPPGVELPTGAMVRDRVPLHQRRATGNGQVADVTHVDRTHVSRLEHGGRWPSRSVAEALDTTLDAGGHLFALWEQGRHTGSGPTLPGADPDLSDRFARVLDRPERVDRAVVDHLAVLLDEQRRLEDVLGAGRVLPTTLAQLDMIDTLSHAARDDVRRDLLSVGAQWRQFAAWESQDLGHAADALAHYDRAADAAHETGDDNMAVSVLSLKSHLAWSSRDPGRAVGLAAAGRRHPGAASPGVLALIAQQEARGWALDGDPDRAHRLMDHSEELTLRATDHPEDEPPWTYFHDRGRVMFQRGIVDLELGRNASAADLFVAACAALPATYRRDRARYVANHALAAARHGDVNRAVIAGREALDLMRDTGSAHALSDLRAMRAALRPHAGTAAVREFDAAARAIG